MKILNPIGTGAALAAALAGAHILWAILVATEAAQPLVDLVFRLHFVAPAYQIETFNLATAVELILATAAGGFLLGYVLAVCLNSAIQEET